MKMPSLVAARVARASSWGASSWRDVRGAARAWTCGRSFTIGFATSAAGLYARARLRKQRGKQKAPARLPGPSAIGATL